jgi:molybdopterin molybdotransferase
MISVEEATAIVVAAFRPLPAEIVGLEAALGRVLAADVGARLNQPPADVSAMDGYAVRTEDVREVPATLRLIGQSTAGVGFPGAVGPGDAVRIFTGAPVPLGADAVVIQEDAEQLHGEVLLRELPRSGRHIRRKGQDFVEGEALLRAGRMLSARDVGLAAAMNIPWLPVRRKPRVAVIATGDELVMPGEPLWPHKIVCSASFGVAGYLRGFGAEPISLGIARDDEESLTAMLAASRGADLLLTVGGASVGDFDLVRHTLGRIGFDLGFHKVAMRPGKPLIFGRMGALAVLGLPGNPVSAAVSLLLFAKPAIEAMLGIVSKRSGEWTARLGRDLPANGDRQDYLRATLERDPDGDLVALPFDVQDSSMQRLFAAADCLVVRPPRAAPACHGERVRIVMLDDDPIPF